MRQEAIYARQSVDKKDSVSIEAQIEQCRALAKTREPLVFQDKGFSGKNTERPDLKRLFEAIRAGRISTVYVYKLDRISRNIVDFNQLYQTMEAYGTEFVSVNEKFDTSSVMGRAMMQIIAVFAQMERETIQQRVKDNYYYRITDGRWAGGPAPYGYKNARTENNVPTLKPVPEELNLVRAAFSLYDGTAHLSLASLCTWLYNQGYRTRKGGKFVSCTLSRIMQNPVYVQADQKLYKYFQTKKIKFLNEQEEWDGSTSCCIVAKKKGNSSLSKYEDMKEQSVYLTNIPGIVPSHLYISVQSRLKKNEQFKRANSPSALEELAGKLKCASCGHTIKSYSQSTNMRPYLSCPGRATHKICGESYRKVNFETLQEQIGREIQGYLDSIEARERQKQEENRKLEARKEELKKELDNLIALAAKGGLTAEVLQAAIEERQTEINGIELKVQMNTSAVDFLKVNLENNSELNFYHGPQEHIEYGLLLMEQKKELVKLLIEKITLHSDGAYEIEWSL